MRDATRQCALFALILSCVFSSCCANGQTSPPKPEHPFLFDQEALNPETLGLNPGTAAPSIHGVAFDANPTLLIAVNCEVNVDYFDVLALWDDRSDLQVVVAGADLSEADRGEMVRRLDGRGVLLPEWAAMGAVGSYRVGVRASPVTFLIDTDGIIVARWRGYGIYRIPLYEKAISSLLENGELAEDVLIQSVYWTGDVVEWPGFPLQTLSGEDVLLEPGVPYCFYKGPWVGPKAELIDAVLDLLRERYPLVRFVRLVAYWSEATRRTSWETAQQLGLDETMPEWYGGTLEKYLERLPDYRQQLFDLLEETPCEWRILLDEDGQLSYKWTLFASPTLFILDAEGRVVLPCSIVPVWASGGADDWWVEEGTEEYLAALLEEAASP